jgi:hypothetical protein
MSKTDTQAEATAGRGVTPANQTAPAAEHSEWGPGKPDLSNDAEEKLFRPEE